MILSLALFVKQKVTAEYNKNTLIDNGNIILSSSMAEHSTVNRRVVGSSPTWGVF